ncbi:MAG: 3-phosphoglycerate kinase [Gammaproteobacteria bacterium]
MRKLLTGMSLVLFAAAAMAFPTDLELDVDGLNVQALTHIDGRVAGVRVSNHERFAVRCEAVFRNGPEISRARRAVIDPDDTALLSWTPRREVVRLRVELSCRPADEAS